MSLWVVGAGAAQPIAAPLRCHDCGETDHRVGDGDHCAVLTLTQTKQPVPVRTSLAPSLVVTGQFAQLASCSQLSLSNVVSTKLRDVGPWPGLDLRIHLAIDLRQVVDDAHQGSPIPRCCLAEHHVAKETYHKQREIVASMIEIGAQTRVVDELEHRLQQRQCLPSTMQIETVARLGAG
jgi:hypothetical protein